MELAHAGNYIGVHYGVISWEEVLCLITASKLSGTEWWSVLRARVLSTVAEANLRLRK